MIRFTVPPASVALLLGAFACSSAGRGGAADPTLTPSTAGAAMVSSIGDTTAHGNAAADVRFLQGMIPHHAQALTMVAMIPARSTREEMRLLGERIAVSQRDEIASMRRWLESRGEYAPAVDSAGAHAHGAHAAQPPGHEAQHHAMPGMLTDEELSRLAAASGNAFDRLLLELMIRHHEGALVMVRDLFGTPGAAQEPELFGLASEIDADQRAEIDRMRAVLRVLPGGAEGL
jgi:uncharacterized protein (DUF305 family)